MNSPQLESNALDPRTKSRGCRDSIFSYITICLLLWLIIGGLLVVNNIRSDSERIFMGFLGAGTHQWVVDDGSLYLDMIEQAQDGAWLFQNRFSSEIGPPSYLNSVWVVLGKLSALIGLTPLEAFTLFRFLAIPVFVFALRRALRECVRDSAARFLALVLIVFGGGFGWIFGIINHWFDPAGRFFIEGSKSEIWCFLALMVGPHNTLAMALVIWVMCGLVMSSRGVSRALWVTPIIAFVLSAFHPYDLPVIYSVGGLFLVMTRLRDGKINRSVLLTYIGVMALSAPVLAYHYWALSTAPDLQGLFLQNDIAPRSSIKYLIGLLPIGLLAFRQLTIRLANFRTADNPQMLIMSWAVMLPVLLYSFPDIGFAWKLTIAMPLPICVLAVEWIEQHQTRRDEESVQTAGLPLWRSSPAITGVVIVSLLSSALVTALMLKSAKDQAFPYYLFRAEYDALTWLSTQPGKDDTVLSWRYPGVFVPRLARKRAFIGHDHQSVDFKSKFEFARLLFVDEKLSDQELQVLRRNRVRWLLYGRYEQGWWPDPGPSPFISLAYDRYGVRIYRIEFRRKTED